jgi:hypothetical protein
MINAEIYEGIRLGMLKGQSLKQAMMSFYNAGYPKNEIEEAARALQLQQFQQTTQPGYQPPMQSVQPREKLNSNLNIKQANENNSAQHQNQIQQPMQRISSYGEQPQEKKSNIVIILLAIILIMLIGILASAFIFKDAFITFINNLFK